MPFLLRMLPGGKLLLGFLAGDAVRLLDLSRELLALARARVELIAGELAPVPQGVALEMLPLAFNAIPFHLIPFWQRSGCRVFLDHPMMRAGAPSHRCASAQRGSDPDFSRLAEEPHQERFRGAVDPRALALARPGDVQHAHAVPRSPGAEALRADAPPELHDEQGLAVAPERQLGGEQRPAVEPAAVDDQRAVRIAHVPLRALDVIAGRRLDQAVAPRDAPVLRSPALRAPAPALDPQLPRRVERRAVHARLPAGNDLPQQTLSLARQLAALDELRE